MKKSYISIILLLVVLLSAGIYAINLENSVSNQQEDNDSLVQANNSQNSNNVSNAVKSFDTSQIIKNIVLNDDNKREISVDGVYMDEDERHKPTVDSESVLFDPSVNPILVGGVVFTVRFSTYVADIFSHSSDTDENGNYLYSNASVTDENGKYIYPSIHNLYLIYLNETNQNYSSTTQHYDPITQKEILYLYNTKFGHRILTVEDTPETQKFIYSHANDVDLNGDFIYPDIHNEYLERFGDKDINDISIEEFTPFNDIDYNELHKTNESPDELINSTG